MRNPAEIVKDIVLVRSGQSEARSAEIIDGMNPGLSEPGQKQMEAVKSRLSGHTFDFVYVSPLLRAYQSYLIASPKAYFAELDTRIIENDEGRNWYQPLVGYLPTDQLSCRFGNGWLVPCEVRAEMIAEDIKVNGGERILVLAHQGIIKYLIAAWLGLDGATLNRSLILDNGSFTGISLDKGGNKRVQYLNDTSHLTDDLCKFQYFRPGR